MHTYALALVHPTRYFTRAVKLLIYDYDFMVNLLTLFLFDTFSMYTRTADTSMQTFVSSDSVCAFFQSSPCLNEQIRQKWQ